MTSQEKDKFICEKLGIEWHDVSFGPCNVHFKKKFSGAYHNHCDTCQTHFIRGEEDEQHSNPDFTSEAGIIQLLRLVKTHKNYADFGDRHLIFSRWDFNGREVFAVPEPLLTDNNGKFRDEVYGWLGGEG